jgi:putative MATE family efflux protein
VVRPIEDPFQKNDRRSLFALIFALAWPTVMEQFLETIVQYIDTGMVGKIGANASAAVGLSTSLTWLIISPMFAMGIALLAMMAKAIGEGDVKKSQTIAHQAIFVVIVLGVIEGVLATALSGFIPVWMGADIAIHSDAAAYFKIISLPMIFRAAMIVFASVIRATGDTRTPLKINLFVNGLNIGLNFFLIYGSREVRVFDTMYHIWGADMGTTGAAVGTAVSITFGGLLMALAFIRLPLTGLAFQRIAYNADVMRQSLKIGWPIAMNKTITSLGYVVFAGLVSSMGAVVFAAHAIATVAEMAFYIPGYGMQAATSTLVGYTLGKRDMTVFMRVVKMTLGTVVGIMIVSSLILFLGAESVMRCFTGDAAVIALGAMVLKMIAFSEPFFAASIVLEGVYNGLGKTKIPFGIETGCMWLVRILPVWVIVHTPGASGQKVWACMILDNLIKTALLGRGLLHDGRGMALFAKTCETGVAK